MSQRRCYLCGGKVALRYKDRESYQQRLGKSRLVVNKYGEVIDAKIDQTHLFCCTNCANWWLICRGLADRWNGVWSSKTRHAQAQLKFDHRYPYFMGDEEYERVNYQLWSLV